MIDEARNVSAKELAGWLSASAESVDDLARRGVIERTARGRYPLSDSVRRYAEHMRRLVTASGPDAASMMRWTRSTPDC